MTVAIEAWTTWTDWAAALLFQERKKNSVERCSVSRVMWLRGRTRGARLPGFVPLLDAIMRNCPPPRSGSKGRRRHPQVGHEIPPDAYPLLTPAIVRSEPKSSAYNILIAHDILAPPEEIRTPDPQIRSLMPRLATALGRCAPMNPLSVEHQPILDFRKMN